MHRTLNITGGALVFAAISVFLLSFSFATGIAHAHGGHMHTVEAVEEGNTNTSTCTVGDFTPHIYDGELHSFDYIVEGVARESVVITQTTLDEDVLDARYSTKWAHEGGVRVHVEVPSWESFSGASDITVHVKSVADGSCETQQTFATGASSERAHGASATLPSSDSAQSGNNLPESQIIAPTVTIAGDSETGGGNTEQAAAQAAAANALQDGKACETFPQSWWIGLVLAHVIAAGGILFLLREQIEKSNVWFAVALLVPFVALLSTWFIFDECRSHQWFPIAIALISLGTVLSVPDGGGKGGRKKKSGEGSIMLMPDGDKKK